MRTANATNTIPIVEKTSVYCTRPSAGRQRFPGIPVAPGQRSNDATSVIGNGEAEKPPAHGSARHAFGRKLGHHGQANGGQKQFTGGVEHVQEHQVSAMEPVPGHPRT